MKASRIISITSVFLSVLVAIPVAYAAINFKGGANGGPTASLSGNTLSVDGVLTGLGNVQEEDVIVVVSVAGDVTGFCKNSGSKETQPPGQNKPFEGVAEDDDVDIDKNGNAAFETDISPILTCKGGGITPVVTSVTLDELTVSVFEDGTSLGTLTCQVDGTTISQGGSVKLTDCS